MDTKNWKKWAAFLAPLAVVVAALIQARCVVEDPQGPTLVTRGDNSPAIFAEGDVNITEGMARETAEALLEWADNKDRDTSALREALSDAYRRNLEDVPRDAGAWAEGFVASLPDRKAILDLRSEEMRRRSEERLVKVPKMFELADTILDSRIRALQGHLPGLLYERQNSLPDAYSTDPPVEVELGAIRFPNECVLLITFEAGLVVDDLVKQDPSYFVREPELCKNDYRHRFEMSSRHVSLGAGPSIDVGSFMDAEGLDRLRENFEKRIDHVIGDVAAR